MDTCVLRIRSIGIKHNGEYHVFRYVINLMHVSRYILLILMSIYYFDATAAVYLEIPEFNSTPIVFNTDK